MNFEKPYDIEQILHEIFITDDEEVISRFASHCRIVTKKKGDLIWVPGSGNDSTSILLEGIEKTYIVSPDGTENTLTFWFEPGTIICVTNDMTDIPGVWCKTVTPCTMVEMVGMNPYLLAEEVPELWKELAYGSLPFAVRIMNKARAGYTLNAKERYLWFLDQYGPIADKVSQVDIASFLGIKPQSLSRIRAELMEQGLTPPKKLTSV